MDESDDLARLGATLNRLRAERGWDVKQLADQCGRSRTTVSQALNTRRGRPAPSIDTVTALCQVLKAAPDPLLDLLHRGNAEARVPPPGPRARDDSRQFTREASGPSAAELAGIFDPLRRENLERSVQWALEAAPSIALSDVPAGVDTAVFALYYQGPNDLYRVLSTSGRSTPIYVGNAVPPGGRHRGDRGPVVGNALKLRMKAVGQTIEQGEGLAESDFRVRFVPVDRIWIPGAELLMIGDHRPVWNTVLRGFGMHGPGRDRIGAARSPWDELHPGRPWAVEMRPYRQSAAELRELVRRHFGAAAEAV